MMWNATFGFDTDTIKIYSSPVIRCLKNNLLYTPFYSCVGIRNIYDSPDALLELKDTFKRSLNIPV